MLRKDVLGNIIGILDREGKSIVKYKYDGWGNHVVLDGNGAKLTAENCTATNKVGILNPFRYRSYYYDTETGLYFLKTRYYDPEVGRFITIDDISYLAPDTINGLNLYAYCGNNPVMRTDSQGTSWWNPFSWDWKAIGKKALNIVGVVLDVAITVASITIGVVVGGVVFGVVSAFGGPILGAVAGIVAGTLTTGAINNIVNGIYYMLISDGKSSLSGESYQKGYITRWERLDYAKQQTGEKGYFSHAWRYYGEYSAHMYGWFATGWAKDKNMGVFSKIAEKTYVADINSHKWDSRWYVNILTVIFGMLGI